MVFLQGNHFGVFIALSGESEKFPVVDSSLRPGGRSQKVRVRESIARGEMDCGLLSVPHTIEETEKHTKETVHMDTLQVGSGACYTVRTKLLDTQISTMSIT